MPFLVTWSAGLDSQMTTYQRFLEQAGWGGGDSLVEILPAPLAKTVSWKTGTDQGPAAILAASDTLELFDDELLIDTYKIGLSTLAPLPLSGLTSKEACAAIEKEVAGILARDRFPVLLGGEHTISLPAVAACRALYSDLHVLQIDAHLDLRDHYQGDPLSHACVMRRISDLGLEFTQVGIRSFSREEWRFVVAQDLKPFTMSRIQSEPDWITRVVRHIKGPVYVTIDVDGLDAAVMPATGTPEPGGLSWRQLTDLLRIVAVHHRIVAMDCVEFSPVEGAHHAAYTAAKLVYRCLGYIFGDRLPQEEWTNENC